jgi:hypothetical protein
VSSTAQPSVDPNAAAAITVPGIDPASSAEQIREDNDQLRATIQKVGTGVGSVATVVLGAVGFTRADDIFAFPAGEPGWVGPFTAVAAGLALFGSAAIVGRFFAAQRPILIGSDLSGLRRPWLYHPEYDWVTNELRKQTRSLGERDLYAMDLRANRLARVARRLDPELSSQVPDPPVLTPDQQLARRARRESVHAEDAMRYVLLRVAGGLLQRRADQAFGSRSSILLIALAVGGTAWTFGVGDWAKGQRTLERDKVLRVHSCERAVSPTAPDLKALLADCLGAAKP